MDYRKAEEADIRQIVTLLNECAPFVLAHHDYVYWILGKYYQSTTFVCTWSDKTIGFICGLPSIDQSTIFVWQVCVHPDFRKRGVALELVKRLYDTSVQFGFNNLQLSVTAENSISKHLFKKFSVINSLQMDCLGQGLIAGKNENIYKISKIDIL